MMRRMPSDELSRLRERALRVHDLYDDLNLKARGRTWTREEFALGFVGDVGDLAKLVMAAEGARTVTGSLGHELADCLWSVLILAHKYEVDLAGEFDKTMDELEEWIEGELDGG
jgi:NTP pyrophosphatase (non-canonical NTP hydrolase)